MFSTNPDWLLTGFERSAVREGISGHVPRARADGCEPTEVALGVGSTGVDAGVDTGIVDAGWLVAGAFAVWCAFGGTDPVGIAVVTLLKTTNKFCIFVKVLSKEKFYQWVLTLGHLQMARWAATVSQSALTPQSPQGLIHLKSRHDCWTPHSPSDSHSWWHPVRGLPCGTQNKLNTVNILMNMLRLDMTVNCEEEHILPRPQINWEMCSSLTRSWWHYPTLLPLSQFT